MTENTSFDRRSSFDELDRILGRSSEKVTAPEAEASPETAGLHPAPAKEDVKAEKRAARKAKRAAKNGVSFFLVLLIIISINAFWLGFIRYHVIPEYQSQIDEVIAEKDDAIKRIQAIYKVREEEFEKRITACEEKQAELEQMYNNAIKIIEKYGGDLSFLDDENNAKEVKD